jgi:hypothetical protein
MSEGDLRDFFESSAAHIEQFGSAKQAIAGARRIQLAGSNESRDKAADRIYAIRCRLVHSKQDGGGKLGGAALAGES